jgi:hypothetical protein
MNIFHVLEKDLRQTGIITAGLLVLIVTLAVLTNFLSMLIVSVLAVILSGAYLMTALLTTERYEDKNNGYVNLLRMPVHPVELAAGKLVPIYLMNLLVCGLVIVLVRLFGTEARMISLFGSIALMAGCAWLLMILLMYSGICIFGFTKFTVIFRVVIMSILVGVQVLGMLAFKMGKDLPAILSRIGDQIADAPWLLLCLLVSAVYFAFVFACGPLVRRHARR